MLKNYVKIAWRNLVNSKVYSLLNISGLAIGMAVTLLIGLWVYYQYSYDRFLPGYEYAYRVKLSYNNNGEKGVGIATCLPLSAALKKEIPGVQYAATVTWIGPHGLIAGEKRLSFEGHMAGNDFLHIFQFPFIKGDAGTALQNPYSIVLTRSAAMALFGTADVMNKTVRLDNKHDLVVTGVLQDLPENSSFQFKFLVPFSYYTEHTDWVKADLNNWRDNSFQTFVSLQPNVTPEQLAPRLATLEKTHNPADYAVWKSVPFLEPMKNWHLYTDYKNGEVSGGLIDYVRMFSIIGVLILLIACINFMNLSTARYEKRAREVGIRKAVGSQRRQLVLQFLTESVVLAFIAGVFSFLLLVMVLPGFNAFTGSAIQLPYNNLRFWLIILVYVLLTGLLAGSRPAFYLSSFKPVSVLKGVIKTGRPAANPRKILVVLQFSCSVALIISTIVIYRQLQYARSRPKGFDTNRLLTTLATDDLLRNYTALKNDLLQSGFVTGVTRSSSPATEVWSNQRIDDWQGKQPGETLGLATVAVTDTDYFSTMGMQLQQGHNFTGSYGADSLNVVLNEAAVQRMRFGQPLNQVITWHDVPQRVKVIGVVKNALMSSPFEAAQPGIFIFAPDWANAILYRLSPNVSTTSAIEAVGKIFNKYNPSLPYSYRFADESYAAKFKLEVLIGNLATAFAVLAIFISCLGLFGLAAHTAEQRSKEIGIRKVLGASVTSVWALLSKEFIWLVLIALFIASPLAYYFMHNWLQQYAYRIQISWWIFAVSAAVVLLITLLTISFQAIKAALMNPAISLKRE